MTTASITLLEKARQGRRAALTALAISRLGNDEAHEVSIFDEAFDAKLNALDTTDSNVIAFPNAATPRPELLAA